MKAFFLTAAVFITTVSSVFAQGLRSDYSWEVGVNAGLSAFTRPLGPASQYTGNRTNVVPDYSFRATHFFNEHLMLGIDVGFRRWQSYGPWQENGALGQSLSNQQVTFLIASHAINESAEINYIYPFFTGYNDYNKANLYFGGMLGFMTTVNDGSTGYSKYRGGADSGATYLSSYNYGFGIGYTFGVQIGYTYYVMQHLGIGVEFAARYAEVHTNNVSYDYENTKFNLLYFPETISIRYRF